MKRCCRCFCRCIFCCECPCCRRSPINSISDNTRLLPKNPLTVQLLDKQELYIYGSIPPELSLVFLDENIYHRNPVKKIVCGNSHCLVLMNDNITLCAFGSNMQGQLGLELTKKTIDKFTTLRLNPVENIQIREIVDIAAGDEFSLLLIKDNEGNKHIIKYGIEPKDAFLKKDDIKTQKLEKLPEDLEGNDDNEIINIYAFEKRKIILTKNNAIYIGGMNFRDIEIENYELICNFNTKIRSLNLLKNNCLILDANGELFGIGDNTYKELGEQQYDVDNFKPLPFKFNTKIKKVVSGARHIMILLESGDLFCMGDNSESQCCARTSICERPNKIDILQKGKVIDCYAGYNNNVAVLDDGTIVSWGNAAFGKLGYQEDKFSQETPRVILDLKTKCINFIYLGKQMSIFSAGKLEDSIAEKNKL